MIHTYDCELCHYSFTDEWYEETGFEPHFCPSCGASSHLKKSFRIESEPVKWPFVDAVLMGVGFAIGNALYTFAKEFFSA